MLTVVTHAAEKFDAEVVPVPVLKGHDWHSDWSNCEVLIYDEVQMGGDTVEALEHIEWSMFVESDEVSNWKTSGIVERIALFLGDALRDQE
jgi:hypothetical protein